jgi:hypothetical protein
MPKTPAALKRTYNAVVTAKVTARNQLAALSDNKARPARKPAAVHVVTYTVHVDTLHGNDVLEAIHTAEVTVPARPNDTELAIIRRAVARLGGPVSATWWAYEVTNATTELADVVAEWASTLPLDVLLSERTGLAVVDDPDNLYAVLHDGEDYEV